MVPAAPRQPLPRAADLFTPRMVELKDGTYLLRPLHEGDEPILQAFFYSHEPETIYQRYGHMVSEMTRERARELVGVDQSCHPAFGLFELRADGSELLHAVGRYFLDRDGQGGEAAFVTRETKRRLGMSSLLLRTLVGIARGRGLGHLWASVMADNQAMLAVFRRHGFRVVSARPPDSYEVRLDLTAAPKPEPPKRRRRAKR